MSTYLMNSDQGLVRKSFLATLSISGWIGLILLLFLGSCAIFAPWLAPYDPSEINLSARLMPMSSKHWLGTDHLGRDMLSRILHGASVSLGAVFVTLVLMLLAGVTLGGVAGFVGGRTDQAIMRVCDVFMTFPTVVFALFMVAILGTGLTNVIIAIAVTHWAWYARITRGLVISVRHSDYLRAARLSGVPPVQRFIRHILPSVMVQLLVLATLDIGHVMLHVSGLSFLGLGVQSPTPEWGVMINDARQFVWTHPMLLVWPGLCIFLSVMSFNLLGDTLRDKLDPNLGH
ncbi:nickel ABC transporter permease subunit NikC [Oceanospirillum sediminis]|uniref:Nickel ABC transporter permease subunit NikC n=1 Tax=Oceanospirillum sediminis TaxID=2760088 RepID=A0A839INN2_9GAMM|nr:nickel ABC transporter permease subunit NikC [Oceanospirillum sediminis]MBB1486109.1 nickel ABC transporter permease subunit NikC [Oceanospirillum sediminis]